MDKTDSKLISEMAKLNGNDSERSIQNSQINLKTGESVEVVAIVPPSPKQNKILSIECKTKILEVFKTLDADDSGTIDKAEALKHWSGAFGKLSAKEFFKAVDENNDGEISLTEFIQFWKAVHETGTTEKEILIELENLKNGEAWVGFDRLGQKQASARSTGS